MDYRYTAIYSIKGVTLPSAEEDKDLVADSTQGLRAILTSQPDSYAFEGDRSLAVSNLMLQALFRAEPTSDEFKQRVAEAVEEIRLSRTKQFGGNPFLVVIGEGEVTLFNPSHEREAGDFIVCFDGINKDIIRDKYNKAIAAIITSLTSEADNIIGIKKAADSVVFFQEGGKPVYSYSASVGAAKAYVSTKLTMERMEAIEKLYRLFVADTTLQRVQRLLKTSLENEEDPLRSFLAAWSAFEILVNKIFSTYENKFFSAFLEEEYPEARKKYLERIRNVMKDKYRLADKFAAIGFQLSPDTADEDLKTVRQVKDIRDELFHGGSVDEANLPVNPIRDLASKYLRLHIEEE